MQTPVRSNLHSVPSEFLCTHSQRNTKAVHSYNCKCRYLVTNEVQHRADTLASQLTPCAVTPEHLIDCTQSGLEVTFTSQILCKHTLASALCPHTYLIIATCLLGETPAPSATGLHPAATPQATTPVDRNFFPDRPRYQLAMVNSCWIFPRISPNQNDAHLRRLHIQRTRAFPEHLSSEAIAHLQEDHSRKGMTLKRCHSFPRA